MIITRFAPSPTGFLHIGSARTALFNWLYAKHTSGKFLLRIEDTDKARSTKEAIDAIINSLMWLGLEWDGDAVLQSERAERHKEVALSMVESGHAYFCYASQEEIADFKEKNPYQKFISPWRDGGKPRELVKPVVRIRAAIDGYSVVKDNLQGEVTISNSQLDDMILLRSDETPTYMLAVVVDDHDMGVTTVIRGDDHFNNAFRQNQIYDATGWNKPDYTHIPLIHGIDGNKLSKRHGATSVEEYKHMGYMPEALLNYLLRLGWSHGDDEIIPIQQAIEWFGLNGLGKSPSRFDFGKLNHINSHYMRKLSNDKIFSMVIEFLPHLEKDVLDRVFLGIDLIKNRVSTIKELAEGLHIFVRKESKISDQAKEIIAGVDSKLIDELYECFNIMEDWSLESVSSVCKSFASDRGLKTSLVMQLLRSLVVGSLEGPSIVDIISLLGKEQVLLRMKL